MRKIFLILILSWFIPQTVEASRDPKTAEMATIQEIANYLRGNAAVIYQGAVSESDRNAQVEVLTTHLEQLSQKSQEFYAKVVKDSNAPWRTTSYYKELNQAFVNAQQAFTNQNLYLADPRPFEEIAFLMGALLQYYQEPVYQYSAYPYRGRSYPGVVYPRAAYPWIPNYYTFSNCRFTNSRLYPWGKGVMMRGVR